MEAVVTMSLNDITSRVAHEEMSAAFGSRYRELVLAADVARNNGYLEDTFKMQWRFDVSPQSLQNITNTINNIIETLDRTDATISGSDDIEQCVASMLELGIALDRLVLRIRESEAEVAEADADAREAAIAEVEALLENDE